MTAYPNREPRMARMPLGIITLITAFTVLLLHQGCEEELGEVLGEFLVCDGACIIVQYNSCTCGPSDPCGWIADGFCDVTYCAAVVSDYFDDQEDCGLSANCDGKCGLGQYHACTCAADDPCSWRNDGTCDELFCMLMTDYPFDDSVDCDGGGGICDGDCAGLRYTTCTCGADDPCGWANNGRCDTSGCSGVTSTPFNDSADCSGFNPTPNLNYGCTAVRDDLDNEDLHLMANGLRGLGYAETVRDINVTTSSLINYLSQPLTLLYHTGHGYDGLVQTADGSINTRSLTINTRNTIFATCLTLVESWASSMGPSADSVLGYTMVSWDIIDNDVVNRFVSALGQGSSYISAWYQANNAIVDVRDRWAGYVREGASIVEYSARSRRNPAYFGEASDHLRLGRNGNLQVRPALLEDLRLFERPVGGYAVLASQPSEFDLLPGGWENLASTRMTPDQAVSMAEAFVNSRLGGLGADAYLDDVVEIRRASEGQPASIIGYDVHWSRQLDGIPISSNRIADHISVLIGPQGPAAWSLYWPQIEELPASIDWSGELIPIGQALELAADELSRSAKGPVLLISARSVYGTPGPDSRSNWLVPAYEFRSADGSRVVVDAVTGRLLR